MIDESSSYFSVPHKFKAYLKPWPTSTELPSLNELQNLQSVGLQLLSEVKAVESSSLIQLRALENDAKTVVDYLKLQSKKIDLILQYVLEAEHQEGTSSLGTKFGGGGIEIITDIEPNIDQHFEVTIFIRDELVAVLAIATVTSVTQTEDEHWKAELSFSRILEADVEILVKASLGVQQKMLKARTKNR
ncbi:hypothetical protein SOPP22_10420 [Shewanella sp. OPT22]|nr:hypothetical protein SOPP22_10420 [Shewanella sp. OPT22]